MIGCLPNVEKTMFEVMRYNYRIGNCFHCEYGFNQTYKGVTTAPPVAARTNP